MKIFYLSEANLRHTPFMKEFVANFNQIKDQSVIVHASFGTARDTRFVTKRISSLLSETLVVNTFVSGDQRKMFRAAEDGFIVNGDLIQKLLQTVQTVVINPLLAESEGESGDPVAMVKMIRAMYPEAQTFVFANHSRSPLVADAMPIEPTTEIESLLAVYDEEAAAINNASALAPSMLVSTMNFYKVGQS